MEENILFSEAKKNILSVYAYTDTSSHFFGSLGKKDGEGKLWMGDDFLSGANKAFNAVNICALNRSDIDQLSGVSFPW